ncbi:MAG TPA: histone deacetylase family protein [Alphaproteobacteria bacterium]|nr:histone deacetylase family protein [Alphaproteobacteria bacterium]
MQVIYSEAHASHAPEIFILAGQVTASPECPERAARLLAGVEQAGFPLGPPRDYDASALAPVHPDGYLDFLQNGFAEWRKLPHAGGSIIPNVHPGRHMRGRPQHIVGRAGYYMADTACPIGEGTWTAALGAAQCALTAADLVLEGAASAYALCRPPGHHAFADMAGGFCFLNNVALAAERLRRQFDRVAILDVDVHHGNGTQGIFYGRGDVFFGSLHGDPSVFYPFFAGYADERGEGAGEGATLNLPLPRGTDDAAYLQALEVALTAIREYRPEALLVSLGLDAQEHDPLGILAITTGGFARIAERIAGLGLPTVLVQEGGYLCDELGANLASFLTAFEAAHRPG